LSSEASEMGLPTYFSTRILQNLKFDILNPTLKKIVFGRTADSLKKNALLWHIGV